MKLLLPSPSPATEAFWSGVWPAWQRQAPQPPFAPESLAFLDAFSKRILLDPALRQSAAFSALAHWARRAHLEEYRGQVGSHARGVVLHLAPANVDTLFAYSWFTSLLCGNLNIVRLSARSLPVVAPLLATLEALLAEPRFAAVRDRTLLVSYEHDDTITRRLSDAAQARLIWGGDETVRAMRALALPATAIEIAFADRFSLAAFDAAYLAGLADSALADLAAGFANDALQFGQKACASPRLVVFTGSAAACAPAARRFWPAVATAARNRTIAYSEADGIARLAAGLAIASTVEGAALSQPGGAGAPPLVVQVPSWPPELRTQHDGAGLFVQLCLPDLPALAPYLTPRDQTLVAAGFGESDFRALVAALPARALDRIVSPGRALDFDPTAWDGQNLLRQLTREVALPHS